MIDTRPGLKGLINLTSTKYRYMTLGRALGTCFCLLMGVVGVCLHNRINRVAEL